MKVNWEKLGSNTYSYDAMGNRSFGASLEETFNEMAVHRIVKRAVYELPNSLQQLGISYGPDVLNRESGKYEIETTSPTKYVIKIVFSGHKINASRALHRFELFLKNSKVLSYCIDYDTRTAYIMRKCIVRLHPDIARTWGIPIDAVAKPDAPDIYGKDEYVPIPALDIYGKDECVPMPELDIYGKDEYVPTQPSVRKNKTIEDINAEIKKCQLQIEINTAAIAKLQKQKNTLYVASCIIKMQEKIKQKTGQDVDITWNISK